MANDEDLDVITLMSAVQACTGKLKKYKTKNKSLKQKITELEDENKKLKQEQEKMKADNKDNNTVPKLLLGGDDRQQKIIADNKQKPIFTKSRHHGLVVICCQEDFSKNTMFKKDRTGASTGVSNLKLAWELFDCKVMDIIFNETKSFYENELTDKIENELKQIQDMKLFVFVLCTHGEEAPVADQKRNVNASEHFFGTSDGKLKTQDLITKIGAIKDLKEKLKVFIIQACRSRSNDKVDAGFELKLNNEAVPQKPPTATDEPDTSGLPPDDTIENAPPPIDGTIESIPHCDDCIVLFSSMSGKLAYRNTATGGWLLTTLKDVLTKYKNKDKVPILDLFTEVNSEIAKKETSNDGSKCQSCFYHNIAFPVQDLILVKSAVPANVNEDK